MNSFFSLSVEKSPIYNDRDWIYTSVGASILEQRISRLSQFIVEAQWRYQLVSWTADITGERPSNGGLKSRQKQTESIPTEKVKPRRTTLQSGKRLLTKKTFAAKNNNVIKIWHYS